MVTRIPSLASLRAFEAVARHLSFRRAADELCVTHAAISHQIKSLESELGVKLFNRTSRSVRLTDEGKLYFPVIRDSLDAIAKGTENLKREKGYEELIVQSYSSFINAWLLPRLTQFQSQNPMIHVRIKTSFEDADFDRQQFDVGIFNGPLADDHLYTLELFSIDMFPVCSPALINANSPLEQPADLEHHLLLQIPSIKNEPDDWALWLSAAGVDINKVHFGPVFDNYPLAVQAALEGQGLVMARRPFAAAELTNGRLIQPFHLSVNEPASWIQVTKHKPEPGSAVYLFTEWLQHEIGSDPNFKAAR
jgi:LysR family glycine cleavage system transcriptional activator